MGILSLSVDGREVEVCDERHQVLGVRVLERGDADDPSPEDESDQHRRREPCAKRRVVVVDRT